MWIMTSFGFIAVAASDRPEWELQVRARDRDVLRKLRKTYLLRHSSKIQATPERDYEFRFYCSKEALAEALDRLVGEINSQKFKPTTLRRGQGGVRLHDLYVRIWCVIAEHYDSPIIGRYKKGAQS